MKKRITALVLAAALLLALSACGGKGGGKSLELPIEFETKFGGVYALLTIEDFQMLGYEFGDSFDVKFSNGFTLENIPFYNGYYTRTGEPLICGYPGYPYIDICYNNGPRCYEAGALSPEDTVTITLHKKGAFLTTQQTMSMVYTNVREDYASDEVFANFREMAGGALMPGLFYRSASPCDDQYNRAAFASTVAEQAGVQFILDLADSTEETADYYANAELNNPYWKSLYEKDCIFPMDLSANYRSEEYAARVVEAMELVLDGEGPYLIHCTEGKDRTGFVCLLIEALAGASLEELERDYMVTYENYYQVTRQSDPDGYQAVYDLKFADMVSYLIGSEAISETTPEQLQEGAKAYLRSGGMMEEELTSLLAVITKD